MTDQTPAAHAGYPQVRKGSDPDDEWGPRPGTCRTCGDVGQVYNFEIIFNRTDEDNNVDVCARCLRGDWPISKALSRGIAEALRSALPAGWSPAAMDTGGDPATSTTATRQCNTCQRDLPANSVSLYRIDDPWRMCAQCADQVSAPDRPLSLIDCVDMMTIKELCLSLIESVESDDADMLDAAMSELSARYRYAVQAHPDRHGPRKGWVWIHLNSGHNYCRGEIGYIEDNGDTADGKTADPRPDVKFLGQHVCGNCDRMLDLVRPAGSEPEWAQPS